MRMWGVDPSKLCRRHLLGEHVEMHMFAGSLTKGMSIKGYIARGLINPRRIKMRHDELAAEIQKRGYFHASPLTLSCENLPDIPLNIHKNELDLRLRCGECFKEQI